jgi:hypothetical protein
LPTSKSSPKAETGRRDGHTPRRGELAGACRHDPYKLLDEIAAFIENGYRSLARQRAVCAGGPPARA